MARLPAFLRRISPVGETLSAMERGMARMETDTAHRNDQLSVATAEEGLSLWERDYALLDGTGMETAVRRAQVYTALAGGQILTPSHLASLAVTVGNADAGEVEENFSAWHVRLDALYEERLPENIRELTASVERLRPAHLAVEVRPMVGLYAKTSQYEALTGAVQLCLTSRESE